MEETITILKVGTEEAVKSVNDLKDNIKVLKDNLGELEIGTEEYQDTLDELKVNQNALKDAMYATSTSMEDLTKAATGTSESYNSLVHRMASLKEEFRATNDEMRRMDLGNQINDINNRLKEMDALQGNFQRNVGNYAGGIKDAFKNMSVNVDAFRKSMNLAGGGLNGLKDGLEGISKSPFIATFGILVSVAIKLADSLKDNETAMAGLKKGMDALKPVMDFFNGILDTIANALAGLIEDIAKFVTSNGLFTKIIQGLVGVGNAIVQYVVAPFKGVIAAIQVFKEQGVKGLGDAARAFGAEMKSGLSFKQNFQAGQVMADTMIAGAKDRKKKVAETGKELGKTTRDSFMEEVKKINEEIDRQIDADFNALVKGEEDANKYAVKKAEERIKFVEDAYAHQKEMNSILTEDDRERAEKEYAIQEELNKKKLTLLDSFMKDALDRGDLESYLAFEQERADLEVEIETNAIREKERLRKQDLKDAQETAKAQKELLNGLASATSSILGSIADAYESDEENAEKNASQIKNLRIASATIDTISGAIGAYMSAVKSVPAPYGMILGAAQAAAVAATGFAEIAKIKKTNVSGNGTSTSASVPAVASAPTPTIDVANVRSVTSASEEERLNQMASPQRVYILASDIEASRNQIRTQVAETSF